MTENTGTSTAPEPKGQILSIQISEVKPWVAIAVLLAVAILGIYAIQSYRGWSSWQRTESLTARTGNLTVILSKDEPPLADIANWLETDQRKLEELRQKFEYVSVDSLIGMLSAIASSSDVDLVSIAVSDATADEIDGVKYEVQPIAVTAFGNTQGIFSFLESLNEPAPSAVVSNVQLAGLDSDPVAKLSFQFYLSPETDLDEEMGDGAE